MVKLRRYLPRFYPIAFLALITFLAWLLFYLRGFEPRGDRFGSYWFMFVIRDLNRYGQPLLCVLLLTVGILSGTFYILQSRHSSPTAVPDSSPSAIIIDILQVIVPIPLIFILLIVWLFEILAPIQGPYHLDSLKHNGHEYNVALSPNWDEDASYMVYECDLQGEKCLGHWAFGAFGISSSFEDYTQNAAKLGVKDNVLYLCIYDKGHTYLIDRVLLGNVHPKSLKVGDPPCGKWPPFDPLE